MSLAMTIASGVPEYLRREHVYHLSDGCSNPCLSVFYLHGSIEVLLHIQKLSCMPWSRDRSSVLLGQS